nr:protein transport protein sec31-like isoform X2 [Peromyscus maniculatus bairdii]
MLSRLIRCSASTQWHRGAPRGPATLRALPPLPHEDPLQGPSSKLGLPGPRLPQPCRGGSLLSTGEGRERLFPRMPPTGSHSGILAPAMLSRGPKDYLKPAQRASGAGGPSRAAPAQSSRGPKGVPPWPIRAGSPMLTCDSTPRFLICISHLILPCSLTKCSDGPVFAYPQNHRRVLPKKSVVRTFSLTLPALRCPVVQPGSVLSHQLELWRLECEAIIQRTILLLL